MTQNSDKIIVHVDADIRELVPNFLQHRRDDVKAILDAMKHGDYETIRILGHSMKGAGSGYGFDTVSDTGKSLEQAAKDRNSGEIQRQVNELAKYLERVEVVYS